jgi:hypothetical protein
MARKSSGKTASSLPPTFEEMLAGKVKAYFRARAIGRSSYERADRLVQEIAAVVSPCREIPLNARAPGEKVMQKWKITIITSLPIALHREELQEFPRLSGSGLVLHTTSGEWITFMIDAIRTMEIRPVVV